MFGMKVTRQQDAAYATARDFCRVFAENMKDFYLLAFLLTANPEKAEQCFVAGLEDSSAGNRVFKEWARGWARRLIIKNAIRLVAPAPEGLQSRLNGEQRTAPDYRIADIRAEMASLLELPAFERFVFVMSVLEGYKDRECMVLLGCTQESLLTARYQALRQIAGLGQPNQGHSAAAFETKRSLNDADSIVELAPAQHLATPA